MTTQVVRRLRPRHYDIIRRLLVGQPEHEICLELGMSESYLSLLKRDALFKGVLEAMQEELNLRFIEKRTEVMDVLEDVSMDAAMLTRNAIHGLIDGKEVPISLRLKSAWDNLDRTGRKAVEKRLVGYVNVGDLVADAYRKKHKIEGDTAPDDFEFLADIKADREGFDE